MVQQLLITTPKELQIRKNFFNASSIMYQNSTINLYLQGKLQKFSSKFSSRGQGQCNKERKKKTRDLRIGRQVKRETFFGMI